MPRGVRGYLDAGGAKNSRLVSNYINDSIDVFPCDEPADEKTVETACFPFDDASFDPAALGVRVGIGQIPEPMRGIEPVEFAGFGRQEGDG